MRLRLPIGLRIALWTGIPLAVVTGLAGFLEYDRTHHEARDAIAVIGQDFLQEFNRRIRSDVIAGDEEGIHRAFEGLRATLPELQRGRVIRSGLTPIEWEPSPGRRTPMVGLPLTLSRELENEGESIGRVVISIDESRFAPTLARRKEQILLHTFLIQAILVFICATIGHSLARRIRALAAQSQRISEGNFSTSAPEGNDELGRVGEAFNRMAKELEQQQCRLAESRDEAVAAASEARRATAAKSEFLANMSHEIRTPLNAVLGFGENLLDPTLSEPDRLRATHAILRNGQHLLTLINDLLDFSKIEARRMDVEQRPVSIAELAAEAVSLLRSRATAKKLDLSLQLPARLPATIQTDPTRLKQILLNLLGNAIKFTERGSVTLHVHDVVPRSPDEWSVAFSVRDTGIGIERAALSRLFQAFTQADSTTTRRFGGTGLGLSISRELARLLGGSISVESEPGRGSEFRVEINAGTLEGVEWIETASIAAPSPIPRVSSLPLRGKFLVAEDGPDNQELFRHILTKAGAEVTVVGDGSAAIETVAAAEAAGAPFDLLILDMQMPEVDGYAAAAELRTRGFTLPIIAVTAHAMGSDRDKCLAAGCDEYEPKPISRKRFLEKIDTLLRERVSG